MTQPAPSASVETQSVSESLPHRDQFKSEFRNGLSVIAAAAHIASRRIGEGNIREAERLIAVVLERAELMGELVDTFDPELGAEPGNAISDSR